MKVLLFKIINGEKEIVAGIYKDEIRGLKKMKKEACIVISNILRDNNLPALTEEQMKFFKKNYSLEISEIKFCIERYTLDAMVLDTLVLDLIQDLNISETVSDDEEESEYETVSDEEDSEKIKRDIFVAIKSPEVRTHAKHNIRDLDKPIKMLPLSPMYTKK